MKSFTCAATLTLCVMSRAKLVKQRVEEPDNPSRASLDLSDRYIVTLKPDADLETYKQHIHQIYPQDSSNTFNGISHEFSMGLFQGFAGHFPPETISALHAHANTSTIEADVPWKIDTIISLPKSSYGLSLISHKTPSPRTMDRYEFDTRAGAGTFAYVLDTGINIEHPQFAGRANLGYNAINPRAKIWNDDFGHGTHVAGLIGGKTFGVARKTQLIAVKVVKGATDASFAQILDGLQWAVKDIETHKRAAKAVVHVSPYGPNTEAWTKALEAAQKKGVTVVIPAGNQNIDPSKRLDPIKYDVITVSATDKERKKAPFANWGPVVDLFAPGVGIESAWGVSGTKVISGTAQAAAYVAGLTVYFKGLEKLDTQPGTKMKVVGTAIKDIVKMPNGKMGRFAYNGNGK